MYIPVFYAFSDQIEILKQEHRQTELHARNPLFHYIAGSLSCDNRKCMARPWKKSVVGQTMFDDIVRQYGTPQQQTKLVDALLDLLNDKTP